MNTLEKSEYNRTTIFYCPFEDNNCLTRTGTADGGITSFFNSVLHSCSRTFKTLGDAERKKLTDNLQGEIANRIKGRVWVTKSLHTFRDTILDIIRKFYHFVENGALNHETSSASKLVRELLKTNKETRLYSIIIELLPYEQIENIDKSCVHLTIDNYRKNFVSSVEEYIRAHEVMTNLPVENREVIQTAVRAFLGLANEESKRVTFDKYEYVIKHIDEDVTKATAQYFNVNIYFINGKTRLPYVVGELKSMNALESIVLLNVDGDYEPVGVLSQDNIIKRQFMFDDPFIGRINSVLLEESSRCIVEYIAEHENRIENRSENRSENNKIYSKEEKGIEIDPQ